MGIINYFSKKCVFCKSKINTKYVEAYHYGGVCYGDWYHEKCLRKVAQEPENYPERTVDLAIDIINRIRESKKKDDDLEEKRSYLRNLKRKGENFYG